MRNIGFLAMETPCSFYKRDGGDSPCKDARGCCSALTWCALDSNSVEAAWCQIPLCLLSVSSGSEMDHFYRFLGR